MNISTLRRVSVTAVALGAFACTPAAAAFSAPTLTSSAGVGGSEMGDHHQPMPTSPVAYELGETLAKLSGKKLEITFLAEIISHHRAAIEMAKLELERGVDPDIRTHAENIIANQRHQIEQFTRWLHEWYGLTPEQAMEHVPDEARREMEKMEQETQRMTSELRHVGKGKKFDVEFVRHMIPTTPPGSSNSWSRRPGPSTRSCEWQRRPGSSPRSRRSPTSAHGCPGRSTTTGSTTACPRGRPTPVTAPARHPPPRW
ncbi:DUF305 domain-containing protein [Streptomyces griseoincarnatus]